MLTRISHPTNALKLIQSGGTRQRASFVGYTERHRAVVGVAGDALDLVDRQARFRCRTRYLEYNDSAGNAAPKPEKIT